MFLAGSYYSILFCLQIQTVQSELMIVLFQFTSRHGTVHLNVYVARC